MLCGLCKESFPKFAKLADHWKAMSCTWAKVLALRREGKEQEADVLVRKITGTYKEMTEEAKEKLREYYEEHKEEIRARQKLKRMTEQAYRRNIENSTKKLNRKVL